MLLICPLYSNLRVLSYSDSYVDTFVTNDFSTLYQQKATLKCFVYLNVYINRFY